MCRVRSPMPPDRRRPRERRGADRPSSTDTNWRMSCTAPSAAESRWEADCNASSPERAPTNGNRGRLTATSETHVGRREFLRAREHWLTAQIPRTREPAAIVQGFGSTSNAERLRRHICQSVSPRTANNSHHLAEDPLDQARKFSAGKVCDTLARGSLVLDDDGLHVAFRKSPMNRATLHELQRNTMIVLESSTDRSQPHSPLRRFSEIVNRERYATVLAAHRQSPRNIEHGAEAKAKQQCAYGTQQPRKGSAQRTITE